MSRYRQSRGKFKGSTQWGSASSDTHQFTGSVYISGSLDIGEGISGSIGDIASSTDNAIARWDGTDGENIQDSSAFVDDIGGITGSTDVVEIGLRSATSYGIEVISGSDGPNDDRTFELVSGRVSQSGSTSVAIIADINSASLDADHKVLRLSYKDDSDVENDVWSFKQSEIDSEEDSAASLIGTEPNGATSVGAILGSDIEYSASGAKIVSMRNADIERAYVDYSGSYTFNISEFGGASRMGYHSEVVTYTSATHHYTAKQVPAGALLYGVAVRVLTKVPGTEFYIGLSGSTSVRGLWGDSVNAQAGANNSTSSLSQGLVHFPTASSIKLTSGDNASDITTGSVRVELRYMEIDMPTS
jgi:hypothetical protein